MNELTITISIKKLIASGKTEKALQLIEVYLDKINAHELHSEVILLSGRFQTFKKKERLGLKPTKDELNSISFALIEIANQIKTTIEDSPELENIIAFADDSYASFKRKRIQNISLAGGSAISIGVLLFFLGVNTILLSVISTALTILIYLLLEA